MPQSLVDLGYAKDSFNVYYRGSKMEGAIASPFRYTGFNAYYRGKKLKK